MMKSIVLFIALFLSFNLSFAQKFGFIDANFILSKMKSYQKAQGELDAFSKREEGKVQAMFDKVASLKLKYQTEEPVLTEGMKKERLQKIQQAEKEAQDVQQKTFGFEGVLHFKKKELIGPVLEELNKAVQKVAKKNKLAVIYDKSSDFVIVYLDPRHDYTEYVLEELGLGDPEDNPKENGRKP